MSGMDVGCEANGSSHSHLDCIAEVQHRHSSAVTHVASDMPSSSAQQASKATLGPDTKQASSQLDQHMLDDDDDDNDFFHFEFPYPRESDEDCSPSLKSDGVSFSTSHFSGAWNSTDDCALDAAQDSSTDDAHAQRGANDHLSTAAQDSIPGSGSSTVSPDISPNGHASADAQCSSAGGRSSAAAESMQISRDCRAYELPKFPVEVLSTADDLPSSSDSAASTDCRPFPIESSTSSCSYSTLCPEDSCDPLQPSSYSMLFPEDDCCQPKPGFQPYSNE